LREGVSDGADHVVSLDDRPDASDVVAAVRTAEADGFVLRGG
jgi:hypothetical protein